MSYCGLSQTVERIESILQTHRKSKDIQKFKKKIKCIVKITYHLSRRNSVPFIPASEAEWMALYFEFGSTVKKYCLNPDPVYFPFKIKKN